MTHYVRKSESQLWTVGLDTADGWYPVKDFSNPEEAQAYADERNGIRPSVILESPDSTVRMLGRIADALERIADCLEAADARDYLAESVRIFGTE